MGKTDDTDKKRMLKKLKEERIEPNSNDFDEDEDCPVPDGGWGWVVCVGSFVVNFVVDGMLHSFGVLMLDLLRDFQQTRSLTSWVGSTLGGVGMLMGPLVSILLQRFTIRQVTIAGTLVTTVGFIASVFSPNIYFLIFMYGVVGGIGISMVYIPAIITVGLYFSKRRAIATGIATCGSGVGTFTFAYLCEYLLQFYTWRDTVLILTGIFLHCLACGMVFRPIEPRRKKKKASSPSSAGDGSDEAKTSKKLCNGKVGDCQASEGFSEHGGELDLSDGDGDDENETDDGNETTSMVAHKGWKFGSGKPEHPSLKTFQWLNVSSGGLNEAESKLRGFNWPPAGLSLLPQPLRTARQQRNHPYLLHPNDYSDFSDMLTVCEKKPTTALPASLEPVDRLYRSVGDFREETPKSANSGDTGKALYYSESHLPSNSPRIEAPTYREQVNLALTRPIFRKDIYYSGSVSHLAEYQQCGRSMTSFLAQMTKPGSDDSGCSVTTEDENERKPKRHWRRKCAKALRRVIDWKLFKDKAFLFLLVTFTAWTAHAVTLTFLPNMAVSMGISRQNSALLISIVGITNIAGRILAGLAADTLRIRSIWLYVGALHAAAVVNFVLPWCQSFALMAAACGVFGLCMAVAVSMRTIVLAEQLGIKNLTKSFGLAALFQGLAFTVNPPIAGVLFDESGSYTWPFVMAGTLYLISGLSSLVVGVWFKPPMTASPSIILSVEEIDVESCVTEPVSADLGSRRLNDLDLG